MKAQVKKWIIRFLIVELIANIAFFSFTSFLFGSIKPFNPQAKPAKIAVRSGVLQKKGPDSYMQGSYVLKSGAKKTLVETKRNLDEYVGDKVAIKGPVKKTAEGLVKIINGPTIDKRLDVITVKSISAK